MALVRDRCLVPTLDAPELGYIRDSSQQQYVPDVFYKASRWRWGKPGTTVAGSPSPQMTNEYGNEVTKLARPLPVEYLLVEVTTTTPLEPCPSLPGGKNGDPFPMENREFNTQKPVRHAPRLCVSTTLPLPPTPPTQDFHQLAVYYNQQSLQDFALTMADFHLLLYLYKCDVVPLKVASLTGKVRVGVT